MGEVVVFKVGNKESRVSTIVIRGATDNYMDDIERAIDDGVNVFKGVCKDGRLTAGGGSTEIELARQVSAWGETHAGLEQYSINKFAEALEVVPRVLAENSGVKPKEVIAKLYAAHSEGKTNMGFDIEGDSGEIKDCLESDVFDLLIAKKWALKYAVNAARTILRVDQIIMAKRAGSKAERHKRRNGPGRRLNPKNLQARNFYVLCICGLSQIRTRKCSNAIDEAWLIHDLDLEPPAMYFKYNPLTDTLMPSMEDVASLK